MNPLVVSVRVGRIQRHHSRGRDGDIDGAWSSAIYKDEVSGPIWLGELGLAGDEHEYEGHGGPHQAVLAYGGAHYPKWRAEMDIEEMQNGGFGENFTVSHLTEESVCLGDVYQVGDATVQVSQPRQPCQKLVRRWGRPDLAKRVQVTNRTGWYLRVLTQGRVQKGSPMTLLERTHPEWPIARVSDTMLHRHRIPDAARELAACSALSPKWRGRLVEP